ncbi:MAG: restriction endonuclease subunit S [Coriobacteriia bacterium]|nr:restriction endonuclease subunit S [Coriobacteriia bacterium]
MSKLNDLIQKLCPDGVKFLCLDEVSEIRSGWGFPNKEQGKKEGDYPFFKVGDMNNIGNEMFMFNANNYINVDTAKKLKCKPAPHGTIIFPKIGAAIQTNKKRILTVDSCYDNNVVGLIAKDIIVPRFLFYVIQSIDLMIFTDSAGAVPSIKMLH